MSMIATDLAALRIGTGPGALLAAGLTRHRFQLARRLTDSSGGEAWAAKSADQEPASAELRADGVFLAGGGQTRLRELFLTGEPEQYSLDFPGEGSWQGSFLLRMLTLTGKAEGEERFSLHLVSTGPVTFQPLGGEA